MPKNGIVGSEVALLSSFGGTIAGFICGCTNLQSHQQWRSIPCPSCPWVLGLSFFFFFLIDLSYSDGHRVKPQSVFDFAFPG